VPLKARLLRALQAVGVAANIVGVNAKKMAETMGHEERAHKVGHHRIHVTLEQTVLLKLLADDAISEAMHGGPHDAGPHRLGERA